MFLINTPKPIALTVGWVLLGGTIVHAIHSWIECSPSAARRRRDAETREYDRAQRQAQHDWSWPSKESFREQLLNAYAHSSRKLADQFLNAILAGFVALYTWEFPIEFQSTPEQVLKTRDKNATFSLFLNTCSAALLDFTKLLPDEYMTPPQTHSLFTLSKPVDFVEIIDHPNPDKVTYIWRPKCMEACAALANHFKNKALLQSRGLFNWSSFNIYGYSEDDDDPLDHSRLSFQIPFTGTPLFQHAPKFLLSGTIEIPFELPPKSRLEHHWICATSGHGKTQCLQAMIAHDLDAVALNNASVVVIDSENTLIPNIAHLKDFAPGQKLAGKLIYLDPTDAEFPLALNLFDIGQNRKQDRAARYQQSQEMLELFRFILSGLLERDMTQKQRDVFEYSTLLLLEVPDATIVDFLHLLQPKGLDAYRQHLVKLDPITRQFFDTQFDSKGQSGYEGTKIEVAQRLFSMLRNPTFRDMFLNTRTAIDFTTELQSGKVILINTSESFLKKDGTKLFGRFMLALLANAASQRAQHATPTPTYIYIDECYWYVKDDPNALDILARGRKRNFGLILAHQYLAQLGVDVPNALLGLTAIKFAANLNDSDSHTLAAEMRCNVDLINNRPPLQFAAHIRGMDEAVPIAVPKLVVENMPRMTDAEFEQIRNDMRARFCSSLEQTGSQPQRAADPPPAKDDTLYWDITINPRMALKGGIYPLQILADPSGQKKSIPITIPPGTADGAHIRCKGAGMFRRDGTRGDIVLTVNVPVMAQHSQVAMYGDIPDPDEIG